MKRETQYGIYCRLGTNLIIPLKQLFMIVLLIGIFGCSNRNDSEFHVDRAKAEVRLMVSNYINTAESMDAQSMVEYYYESPDFHAYVDGKRYNYTEMKDLVLNNWNVQFKSLAKLEFIYDSIYVYMYRPDQAITFFQAEEHILDTLNNAYSIQTNVTFGCVKEGNDWKIAYEHASYQELQ